MYQNEYHKTIEMIKTISDYAKDGTNFIRCEYNLKNFNRLSAWECLQDMLKEYELEIDAFGGLVDGKRVVRGILFDDVSDNEIVSQLNYIYTHIPIYVLMRKGEEKLAQKIDNWIEKL